MTRPIQVALVGPEVEENLSLRYLAASLQAAGLHASIVPFDNFEHLPRVVDDLVAQAPVLVGLSLAFQRRAADSLALAMALRDRGFDGHITAGGHFATFAATELLTDFAELDSICRGEGERVIVELARALLGGDDPSGIEGVASRVGGGVHLTPVATPPDVATLPWPDRRGEPVTCFGQGIAPLVASRGCYARCSFCCIAAWHRLNGGPLRRLRPIDDVAAEMADLHHRRGVGIFIFHDDDFFGPAPVDNVARLRALADGLEQRDVSPITTVVKARPVDVTPEVFDVLAERLGCARVYVGIESASEQGLKTLRRGVRPHQNDRALEVLQEREISGCTNLLIFDPDTTPESLAQNIEFMEAHAGMPLNFARTNLYAGTPLLERLQREGRTQGDWLRWTYRITDPRMQLACELAGAAFFPRNLGPAAVANHLGGTRFDVEVARRFSPDSPWPRWRDEATDLCRHLSLDSARGLRRILDFVLPGDGRVDPETQRAFVHELSADLRRTEAEVEGSAHRLAREMTAKVGAGRALTDVLPTSREELR